MSVTIDAGSDEFDFTGVIARLAPGAPVEVQFRPTAVNTVPGESFGHSLGFWLMPGPDPFATDRAQLAVMMGFGWIQGDEYSVMRRLPGGAFERFPRRIRLPIGENQTASIVRRATGVAEFSLGREVLLSMPSDGLEYLFGQVVGAGATFSYPPPVLADVLLSPRRLMAPRPCERCPREAEVR